MEKNVNYSIGITTYSYRYEKFLIKLMSEIRKFCANEIILGVNGNYKEVFNEEYRKNILQLSSNYEKVFPFLYNDFRSLSKIWNNIVINSTNEYVLIINDDTTIENKTFFDIVQDNIEKYQTSFEMDSKFCYFVVKKSELFDVGWFDERFLGIGWEDTEFRERYSSVLKKPLLNIQNIKGIKTFIDWENVVVNQKIGGGKYSAFNEEVYKKKLSLVKQYQNEKFYWENKDKL